MTKLNKIKLLHFRGDYIILCFKTQGKPFQIESTNPKADKIGIKIPLDPDVVYTEEAALTVKF